MGIKVTFLIRRDTAANWTTINPVLRVGEPAIETDTRRIKYGNGVDNWNDLDYASVPMPAGGTMGQVLRKFSNNDFEFTWSSLTAGIVSFTPTGDVSATDVQSAIAELDNDKLTGSPINSGDALIPTLNSPWVNYGAGFGGARYYKDAAGIVHIEGLIQAPGGSSTSGVTLFTLLSGYRPPDTLMFVTCNSGGAGRIDIDSAGNVIMQSGNTAFTSLSGISFVPA